MSSLCGRAGARPSDGFGRNSWANNDPAAAAQWVAASPTARPKVSADANIARNWANYDVTAASSWLMGLPAGSAKDSAINAFSNQVFEEDPQAAYQWAESIGDTNQRQSEVYNLLTRWAADRPHRGGYRRPAVHVVGRPEESTLAAGQALTAVWKVR